VKTLEGDVVKFRKNQRRVGTEGNCLPGQYGEEKKVKNRGKRKRGGMLSNNVKVTRKKEPLGGTGHQKVPQGISYKRRNKKEHGGSKKRKEVGGCAFGITGNPKKKKNNNQRGENEKPMKSIRRNKKQTAPRKKDNSSRGF